MALAKRVGRWRRDTRGGASREQFLFVESEDFVLQTTPTVFDVREMSF